MDFDLSEEQIMVRDMVRRFAEDKIKPNAAKWDKDHTFPKEVIRELGGMGLMGVTVPEKWGGAGMDYVTYVLVVSELSKACAGVGVITSVNNSLYCYPVMKYGSDKQREQFLKPVASGKYEGCYGLTEAGAGSDPAALRTTAVLDGDHWIVNGEKKFITNGRDARYMVFAAVTDKEKGYKGISQFVIDLENTPGFSVGYVEDKMGIRASSTTEMVFDDARVPRDAILGEPGNGFRQMLETLDSGRIGIGSQALGIAKACLEEAIEYTKERKQFGKPIAAFQANQFKLADMGTRIDASELLLLRAAWLEDKGRKFEKESAMAKMFASDTAMNAAIEGVQLLGGYGYCSEYAMERHMRDAKITQIYEGTNEIMRLVISRNLLGAR
ncbi:MAG: acyl-CoA dehydrogenase [Deltaproteobacteria bacterium]|nr:acyl-CoA dehydrogenase [Deltaproteobacteria bacterium]